MLYRTKLDMPGIPAGELLFLDDSNKGHIVYRAVNNKNLWFSKESVENIPEKTPEAPIGLKQIEYEPVAKELLSKEETDKLSLRIDEVYAIDVKVDEVITIDNIIN